MDNDYIKVTIRGVYGKKMCYPACAIARAFTDLTGTKTLSLKNLRTIKALGYSIKLVPDEKTQKLLKDI